MKRESKATHHCSGAVRSAESAGGHTGATASKREPPIDLASVRAGLEKGGKSRFWRSLDELAGTPAFEHALQHEFPRPPAANSGSNVSRRDALRWMAASAALSGLAACTKMPSEKIVPYVRPPEEFVPGKPLFYATAMPHHGSVLGLLVESHMGRPTKVEGNPDHPGSLGATDVFAQSSVLTLYDPDRSRSVIHEGRIATWSDFLDTVAQLRTEHGVKKGAGLRILTETVSSPTLGGQLAEFMSLFPQARWHQYEPATRDNAREGARLTFGQYVNTYYLFDQATVVLSLDADFLCSMPGCVRYARDFADSRRVTSPASRMNRLYVVESTPSNTGAMADHRLPLGASAIESFARAVADRLGIKAARAKSGTPAKGSTDWVAALVRDLERRRGSSIVIAGDAQPPVVHALAHAMNHALGNTGKTVIHTDPIEVNPVNQMGSIQGLVADIRSGQVETLVILGGNPVYNAPADLRFADHLLKVNQRIHLSLYHDETSVLCHWHVPEAHFLESWSDGRAYDGTASIIQPLIMPLYNGKSAHEMMAALLGRPGQTPHETVRAYWMKQNQDFERFWQAALEKGVLPGTALPPKTVPVNANLELLPGPELSEARSAQGSNPYRIEILFQTDPALWDGRFANNGWLQELPKPLTHLTWDNAALVSPATAEHVGLHNDDVVRISHHGRELRAPVFIMPGHAEDSVTLHLGHGRARAGSVGTGVGFNAYQIRTSDEPWFGLATSFEKTGERYHLATTQNHHVIDQNGHKVEEQSEAAFRRDLVRVATLEEFRKDPEFAADPPEQDPRTSSLYPPYNYKEGHQWGMSIDLNSCIGCNACVVACQSENNIPVVGKTEVDRGRAMHWIRVDTYFRGNLHNPETYSEVMMCQMCENAPCEYVCPVNATVHSPEGLNLMVYNRCVGTRYCSNNCPYKVRRFNFKLYSDYTTQSLAGLRNPDVTVRSRGVMEKCTYCVQRISAAKIKAEREDRGVHDGEIQTACEQVCPTKAIVFGDINDPDSRVSRLKRQQRQYGLLRELNTRPRTTYLARLRNPNPEIKD